MLSDRTGCPLAARISVAVSIGLINERELDRREERGQ